MSPEELKESHATRTRLLEAAAEVFAEQGYQHATVRDICARAGSNVASVNYHFGDKARLYQEVFRFAAERAERLYPPIDPDGADAPAEVRLRYFIRQFLGRVFDEGVGGVLGKLMAREMIQPTHVLDYVAQNHMKPVLAHLQAVMLELAERFLDEAAGSPRRRRRTKPPLSPEALHRCIMSVVGQILFYKNCRPAVERVIPGLCFQPAALDVLADHITAFSIAGVREITLQEARR